MQTSGEPVRGARKRLVFTTWHFIVFNALAFYTLGAGFLEAFVNYPLWRIIGKADEWQAYHQALGPKIVAVLVIPVLGLSLVSNILLLFFRPPAIARWLVWSTLLLLLVGTLSSFFIQIPIQMQLSESYNEVLVDKLIVSSFWLRELMGIIRCGLVAYMVYCIIKNRTIV
jgi:hypothetical protein